MVSEICSLVKSYNKLSLSDLLIFQAKKEWMKDIAAITVSTTANSQNTHQLADAIRGRRGGIKQQVWRIVWWIVSSMFGWLWQMFHKRLMLSAHLISMGNDDINKLISRILWLSAAHRFFIWSYLGRGIDLLVNYTISPAHSHSTVHICKNKRSSYFWFDYSFSSVVGENRISNSAIGSPSVNSPAAEKRRTCHQCPH